MSKVGARLLNSEPNDTCTNIFRKKTQLHRGIRHGSNQCISSTANDEIDKIKILRMQNFVRKGKETEI
jgi:hypothetical protein